MRELGIHNDYIEVKNNVKVSNLDDSKIENDQEIKENDERENFDNDNKINESDINDLEHFLTPIRNPKPLDMKPNHEFERSNCDENKQKMKKYHYIWVSQNVVPDKIKNMRSSERVSKLTYYVRAKIGTTDFYTDSSTPTDSGEDSESNKDVENSSVLESSEDSKIESNSFSSFEFNQWDSDNDASRSNKMSSEASIVNLFDIVDNMNTDELFNNLNVVNNLNESEEFKTLEDRKLLIIRNNIEMLEMADYDEDSGLFNDPMFVGLEEKFDLEYMAAMTEHAFSHATDSHTMRDEDLSMKVLKLNSFVTSYLMTNLWDYKNVFCRSLAIISENYATLEDYIFKIFTSLITFSADRINKVYSKEMIDDMNFEDFGSISIKNIVSNFPEKFFVPKKIGLFKIRKTKK
jgi:hypothetical protein